MTARQLTRRACWTIAVCLLSVTAPLGYGQSAKDAIYHVVEVVGEAAIVNGDVARARQAARADAMRNAVGQVLGTFISSQTDVQNFVTVRDAISTRQSGFASIESILSQGVSGEVYQVQAKVRVYLTEGKDKERAVNGVIDELRRRGLLRQLRVMVVIPEEHRRAAPVLIPDPAAETAITRAFLQQGFKVVDQKTVQQLRNDQVLQQVLRGRIDLARLHEIQKRTDADVLITGEAFSTPATPTGRIGNSNLWACRARVEVKAILLSTGETIAADEAHAAGQDLSEELASKRSLNNAGETLAPRLIRDVILRAYGGVGNVTARVSVEISGLESFTDATRLEQSLSKVRGVQKVTRESYAGGVLTLEIELNSEEREELPAALEQLPLEGLRLRVRTADRAKIEAEIIYTRSQRDALLPGGQSSRLSSAKLPAAQRPDSLAPSFERV